jgi:hypothetical protein
MKYNLLCIMCFALLLALVYSPITQIGFAKFDDKWMLLDENLVTAQSVHWQWLKEALLRINNLQYAPLNTMYYYSVYKINGFDPYYYHLTSLLIHFFNVLLTWVLTKKMLDIFVIPNASTISLAVTLVWAVLPFNVEAVVWISASKILLCVFLGNLSLICFISAYQKSNKWLYVLSFLAFVFSLFAKEQGVLYALVITAFVCAVQFRENATLNVKKLLWVTSPFLILAFIFGLLTTYISIYGGGSHDVDRYPFTQRFFLVFYCFYFYITNCFVPVKLHYHYPFPVKPNGTLPLIYYLFVVLTLVLTWFGYKSLKVNKYRQFYLFCFSIFLIHMLLTIQIVPLARASMLADRYMYASSVGLLIFVLTLLNQKLDFDFKTFTKSKIIILICFVVYLILLSCYSNHLVMNWGNLQL